MPSVDDAERAVLAVAAREWDVPQATAWLLEHLRKPLGEALGGSIMAAHWTEAASR
jgi:hypothetical protein